MLIFHLFVLPVRIELMSQPTCAGRIGIIQIQDKHSPHTPHTQNGLSISFSNTCFISFSLRSAIPLEIFQSMPITEGLEFSKGCLCSCQTYRTSSIFRLLVWQLPLVLYFVAVGFLACKCIRDSAACLTITIRVDSFAHAFVCFCIIKKSRYLVYNLIIVSTHEMYGS